MPLYQLLLLLRHQIFLGLKMTFRKPLIKPTTVKVPPISAHMDVINSYQCLPFLVITTAIGLISYENRASGISDSSYYIYIKIQGSNVAVNKLTHDAAAATTLLTIIFWEDWTI